MNCKSEIENGENLFENKKIDEAYALFEQVLHNHPENPEALNNLGVIHYSKGDFRQTEDFFLKAHNAKEDYLDPLLNLAELYQNAQRWEQAVHYLEKCIAINNQDPNLFNQLGWVYLEMGDPGKAKTILDRSLELDPNQKFVTDFLKSLEKKLIGLEPKISKNTFNILFVQESPCIRNYKMATALRSRGHKVSLAYTKARLSEMYKDLSDDVYNENIRISNFCQLWDISNNYDIVHCHNEPDALTVAALAGNAPVIHDTHDLISLRANGDPNLAYFEGIANRGSAGRIYTTSYQLEEAKRLYGIEGPSLVFHNYVSKDSLPVKFLPKLSEQDGKVHIVYEGGIGGNTHREFSELLVELANKGIHIHIYPAFYNPKIARSFYAYKTIHYYHPLSPKQILEEMTQYDFGIIPFNLDKGNKRFLDSTIANKLFEYMASGLPVITSPLKSYVDYFNKIPIGITFEKAQDIIKSLPRLREIVNMTDFSKQIYTYEDEVEKLENFYADIMNIKLSVRSSMDEPCPLPDRGLEPFYRLYVVKPGESENQTVSNSKLEKDTIKEICTQRTPTAGKYTDWLKAMIAVKSNFLIAEDVIDGNNIKLDRPNVVIRHDVDFSPRIALKMAMAEAKLGINSTFYIFPTSNYKTIFPIEVFQAFERHGWEIGYHTSTDDLEEALLDIEKLKQSFNIRSTVPHMGNLSICKGELRNHIKVLRDGQRFLVQDDGYIADNGGRLQTRISVQDDGTNRWKPITNANILQFIETMEPGKVYHFLFHPCWYDQELNFIGHKATLQMKPVSILSRQMLNSGTNKPENEANFINENYHRGRPVPKFPAIFIGGTGRSGTTILREIIGTHSQIAAIPYETKLIGQEIFRDFPSLIYRCPPNEKLRLLDGFKRLWLNEFYRFKAGWNVKRGDDQWRGLHKWLEKEAVQKCIPLLDTMAESETEYDTYIQYGRFINALFSKFVEREGKMYWLEKTTPNSVYAPFLYRCFPNLKLINIIRDGRDVACSLSKVTWGIKDPKKALDWWAQNIISALEAQKYLPKNVYLNITYENLVLKNKDTLKQITEFIGVKWDDILFSIKVFEQSVGRWKNELPDEAKDYAEAKYKQLLELLGYQSKVYNPYPSMIGPPQRNESDAAFYDSMYRNGGWQKQYHKHYRDRSHFPAWKIALSWLQELGTPRILEVGCGSGQFANMLFDNGLTKYTGFDFSPLAIKMARNNNPQFKEAFSVDNAYTSLIYDSDFDVAVIFEVLEHIDNDLIVLERNKPGTIIVFSVPNFDSVSHVRRFENQTAILERYDKLIEISDIKEIDIAGTTNKIYLVRGKRFGHGND